MLNLKDYKVIIFDVDGTLYNQKKLRKLMMLQLMKYYIMHLNSIIDLFLLNYFRKQRNLRAIENVDQVNINQYKWVSDKFGVSIEKVQCIVQKWMYNEPLKYLNSCRYPGVDLLFKSIKENNILTVIFSDYPSVEKLHALDLNADLYFSAIDDNIDKLKPNEKGLLLIMETLNVMPEECLFIGDRDDRDGECARRVNMPYLIINDKFDFESLIA
jgi:HAD superfamily hydrolase (TIGR01549 family)